MGVVAPGEKKSERQWIGKKMQQNTNNNNNNTHLLKICNVYLVSLPLVLSPLPVHLSALLISDKIRSQHVLLYN